MEAPTSTTILELKLQEMVESAIQQKYPCIDQWKNDHETMKQSMQILRKRVQDLEKELLEIKVTQQRKYRKGLHEWLKTMRPQIAWTDWVNEWIEQITIESLERVFLAQSFLDTFLYELKKLRPTSISLQHALPEELCPVVSFQEGAKRNLYVWDPEKEDWLDMDYSHLRKIISVYIHRIREWWIHWQKINANNENQCDKYNSYISKPVSVLYKESHKTKMLQVLKSS